MKTPEMIQVDKLKTFENHPYKVEENEEMEMLTQSIKENGILSPLIVRPIENSEYEIISGHRRLFASKRAWLTEVPAFVYEMDRDKATIALVDSNLHREHLLPSEKAFAYKMKVEAMSRQGERTDLTSSQVGKKLNAYETIAEKSGESRNQIHRYIRLTNLIPELLEYVDEGRISFTPAVELSYLNDIEQRDLLQAIELNDCTPSLSQAQRLKKFSKEGNCSLEAMKAIMSEEKKGDLDKVTLKADVLKKYFPKSYTPQQMEEKIISLLEQWQRKRQQQMER